jgi:hypothetical protein
MTDLRTHSHGSSDMETRPLVVLLGDSVVMGGIAISLAGDQLLEMTRLDDHAIDVGQRLHTLKPDLVIFELDTPRLACILALLWEQPDILLMGLDPACSRAFVLNSHQHRTPTLNELCRVVQAEAGQKALSKGGGLTECNGTTRG